MKTLWTYYFSLLFNTSHILRLRTMKCQLNFIFFFFFFFFFSFFFAELIELLSLSKRNIAEACLAMAQEKYKNFRLFSESQNVYFTLSKVLDPKKKSSLIARNQKIYIYLFLSNQQYKQILVISTKL